MVMDFKQMYRIKLIDERIHINSFGITKISFEGKELPMSISQDEAPTWLDRKLATLLVLPYDPPTQYVEGLGRRIARNIFWVEHNGDDTGKES